MMKEKILLKFSSESINIYCNYKSVNTRDEYLLESIPCLLFDPSPFLYLFHDPFLYHLYEIHHVHQGHHRSVHCPFILFFLFPLRILLTKQVMTPILQDMSFSFVFQ